MLKSSNLFDKPQNIKYLIVVVPILLALYYAQAIEGSEVFASNTKILIVILLLITVFQKRNVIRINIIDAFGMLFILWLCLSVNLNHQDYRVLYPVFILTAYYILIRQTITKDNITYFFIALVLTALIVSCYPLLQYLGILSNSFYFKLQNTGFFVHTAPLAGFLAVCLPLTVYVIIRSPRNVLRLILLVSMLICCWVIFQAQSRAAWLGLVSALFLLLSLKYGFALLRSEKGKLILSALAFMVPVSGYLLYLIRPVSGLGRLFVWKTSLNIVKDYPLTGIGYSRFSAVYFDYQSGYFLNGGTTYEKINAQLVLYPFNEFLRITIETGVTGLLLFSLMLLASFWQAYKFRSNIQILTIVGCLIVFIVFSVFSYAFDVLPLSLLFCFFAASIASLTNSRKKITFKFKGVTFYVLMAIACILAVSDSRKAVRWDGAIHSINYKHDESLGELNKLYYSLNNFGPFLYDYGIELVRAKKYRQAIPILEQEIKNYYSFNQYGFLALAYTENGEAEKAKQLYHRLYYAEPSNAEPLYEVMLLEIECKNLAKAKHIAEQIIGLKCLKSTDNNLRILKICHDFVATTNN